MYFTEMNRLIDKNFAVKAEDPPKGRIWYLPHFGVKNVNKPGKVRLVFDAAAKSGTKSFNDLLLTGPDFLKSLLGVLMRFRQNRVAVKGDVRDMFLKIKIRPEDRDAQRFLWRGADRSIEPQEYIMSSLLFGAKSSPCSALYIKNKNAREFALRFPESADSIINNCYMDDFLDSCNTTHEAEERIRQVIQINSAANWQMHGWASNEPSVLRVIKENNTVDSISLVKSDEKEERVLGLQWLTESDSLAFRFGETKIAPDLRQGNKVPTKRQFLSVIMSVFDPLGLISPFTIQARILLQDIWTSQVKWDEKLHDSEFERWKCWLKALETVELCKIRRCYQACGNEIISVELHVFCDASEKAYAAVAYWRFKLRDSIHTSIIMSKSRVAPLKPTTIPRLELQAAVLGVRLAETIINEHKFQVERRVFWSDSQTVLRWVRNNPRDYKTFVMNRLGEISEKTKVSEWKWVPTKDNPADDATRWAPDALSSDSRWFIGPPFVREAEDLWPIEETFKTNQLELEKCVELRQVICNISEPIELPPHLPDYNRFSSWSRLIRSTACVLLSVDKWKKVESLKSSLKRQRNAEELWYREIQNQIFNKEIKMIKSSKQLSRENRIASLNPFVDVQGLLRVNGRVDYMPDTKEKFQPIILDGKHPVVQLLIKYYHEKYFHKGQESVINELRQEFWILGIRRCLRSLVNKCFICRMLRAHPSDPKMADLPPARLGYHFRPFTHCGIDYFGPINVKIGRRREKRWGVLFTCMTVRAIYVDLAHSLSADSAIMAIQRFAARRGFPQKVYSDNGTNFRAASIELREAIKSLDKNELTKFSLKNNFEWHFNPPTASHMGGAWERQIRTVKECLSSVLKEHAPSEETLLTILAEIEHSVNSRPLTHVSPDPKDPEALTPNHFLFGSSSGTLRLPRYDVSSINLKKQWLLAQHFADAFWKRWLREYLPTLLPRKKWFDFDIPLEKNDLVLILDNDAPRNSWRKGVITRVFTNKKDNVVRSVEVKTSKGLLIRPSRKIVKFASVQNA